MPAAAAEHDVRALLARLDRAIEIDFKPTPRVRWGHGQPLNPHILRILQAREQDQLAYLENLVRLAPHFSEIPLDPPEGDVRSPSWNVPYVPTGDGMLIVNAIDARRPATFMEIGSGTTTKFARWAIDRFSPGARIVSIDPQPRAEIDQVCDEIIRAPLEETDLSVFDSIRPGDVLFMDGSHLCFQNSDVTVFFLEVLPALPEGVTVGIHDIFWPLDYPPTFLNRHYNEQYMLGAYMLGRGERFKLLCASCHVLGRVTARVFELMPPELVENMRNRGAGSLWFET